MYLYLELDGKVYTVRREGAIDLPRVGEDLPFEYEILHELPGWCGEGVLLGKPLLDRYPIDWIGKDEVPTLPEASRALREAVHRTMPRAVADGIVEREGKLLLVKGARGYTAGRWSLPGGFLTFGESPAEAVEREVREELRVPCRVGRLLGVRTKVGRESQLHWIIFFLEAELLGEPDPDPDEISEAGFFEKEEAAHRLCDEAMAAFLRELYGLNGDRSRPRR